MTDREVRVEKASYQDSELLCNLKLIEHKKGGVQVMGFTRGEAEQAHRLLGEVLK